MLRSLTRLTNTMVRNYMPNAYVIVLSLTVIIFLLGIVFEGQSPASMTTFWGESFFDFLSFSMQLALVLVTGIVLGNVPVFKRYLQKLASYPKSPLQGYLLAFIIAYIANYINWGLGMVVGAIMARAIYERMKKIDFPFLVAVSYMGGIASPIGLASSIPLIIATPGHFLEEEIGIVPTSATMFHISNIIIAGALFITFLILIKLVAPKEDDMIMPEMLSFTRDEEVAATSLDCKEPKTLADRMEHSMFLSLLIGILALGYVVSHVVKGGDLNINIIILTFLALGIVMHKTPINIIHAFEDAGKVVPPIMLQFPFYAGIMGMLIGSGLGSTIAQTFASISNGTTFPMLTFWASGLVNIFVPTGGGQWGVQAPIQIPAAMEFDISPAITAMSVAWGDQWTNLIQPFWTLPILAMVGLKVKDIMGYCVVFALCHGIVTSLIMLFVY